MAKATSQKPTELVDIPAESTELQAAKPVRMPSSMGATFAERASANKKASGKAVQSSENKGVTAAEAK